MRAIWESLIVEFSGYEQSDDVSMASFGRAGVQMYQEVHDASGCPGKGGKVRGELSVTISIPSRRPAERISAIRSTPHAPTCLRYCHSTSSATRLPARGIGSAVTDVGPREVRLKPSGPGCSQC